MDINAIIKTASQDPRFQQVVQTAKAEMGDFPPEQVDELIKLIEFALQNPQRYPEARAAAIADGMAEEGDLPQQFDPVLLASVLVVLYQLRDSAGEAPAFARGGLNRFRSMAANGRHGDTMLAHINPREAEMLAARGGSGSINPQTGLPEFFSLSKLFKAILPIAVNFIAPGLGSAIGTAMGATGVAATALGGAVIGGLSSAVTGGNPLQGALLGGIGGGLGGMAGSAANNALGLGLGSTGQSVLGGALVGGVAGAATGQGFGQGMAMGALGSGLGQAAQGVGSGAVGAGIGAAGQSMGNMMMAGYDPKTALAGGALSGLATGIMGNWKGDQPQIKPSQAAVRDMTNGLTPSGTEMFSQASGGTGDPSYGYRAPVPSTSMGDPSFTGAQPTYGYSSPRPTTSMGSADLSASSPTGAVAAPTDPFSLKNMGMLAVASSLMSKPPDVANAINSMSPAQQEYFNRPGVTWDWNKLQADAGAQNMSLSQFMVLNWPALTSGAYNTAQPEVQKARGGFYAGGGGALSSVSRMMKGGGSGRADTIDAKLSDGEYVMDAETVAMLGDGSTGEGAKRLDAMREQLRRHKGGALAKGKFSPNAKSPLTYLKGAA